MTLSTEGDGLADEYGGSGLVADHVVRHGTEEGERGRQNRAVETLDNRGKRAGFARIEIVPLAGPTSAAIAYK